MSPHSSSVTAMWSDPRFVWFVVKETLSTGEAGRAKAFAGTRFVPPGFVGVGPLARDRLEVVIVDGVQVLDFVRRVQLRPVNRPFVGQLFSGPHSFKEAWSEARALVTVEDVMLE